MGIAEREEKFEGEYKNVTKYRRRFGWSLFGRGNLEFFICNDLDRFDEIMDAIYGNI